MKISEDTFYNEFNPLTNHIVRSITNMSIADGDICSFDGKMYETFGEEFEYIRKMAQDKKTAKHIWTIVDTDGELVISAGFHFVNRMGYIITEKEWNTGDEEVENDTFD